MVGLRFTFVQGIFPFDFDIGAGNEVADQEDIPEEENTLSEFERTNSNQPVATRRSVRERRVNSRLGGFGNSNICYTSVNSTVADVDLPGHSSQPAPRESSSQSGSTSQNYIEGEESREDNSDEEEYISDDRGEDVSDGRQ